MIAVEPKRAASRSKEHAAVPERNQCIWWPGFGGAEAGDVVAEVAVELGLNTDAAPTSARVASGNRRRFTSPPLLNARWSRGGWWAALPVRRGRGAAARLRARAACRGSPRHAA